MTSDATPGGTSQPVMVFTGPPAAADEADTVAIERLLGNGGQRCST